MTTIFAALVTTGFTLLYAWGFWLLYVLVMAFYRAHRQGRLKKWSLPWLGAAPVVFFAYLVDLFANWVFATIWFSSLPRSWGELVTDRLSRYLSEHKPGSRKHDHAKWVCETLLDYFDPSGVHCKNATLTGKS